MRKYGFIKKVCSAVTAAVMVASMGMTASAEYTDGEGIKITNIGYQKVTGSSTLYTVTVDYETTVANDIGVTMLTYAKGTTTDTMGEGTVYADGMQIVAIDQKAQATAGTGSFTFMVTTGTDNGAIKVEEDVPAVVRLGGDKVTKTAAGLLTIASVKEATVSSAKYDGDDLGVNKYSYSTDDDVVNAIKDKGSVGVSVYATIGSDSKKVGTVQVNLANATAYTKQEDDSYKVSGFKITDVSTIVKEATYSGYTLSLPDGGITVDDITVSVTLDRWWADSVVLKDATDNKYEVTLTDGMTVDQVKQTLVGKYVVVSETGNDKAKAELEITSDAFTPDDSVGDGRTKLVVEAYESNPTTVTKDAEFKYVIKVPTDHEAFGFDTEGHDRCTVTIKIVEKASVKYGDVDKSGVVDMSDAALIMQRFLGSITKFDVDDKYADVDKSNVIDMSDAALIMQHFLGSITKFPAETE